MSFQSFSHPIPLQRIVGQGAAICKIAQSLVKFVVFHIVAQLEF
jgi:hypothetical protein